MRLWGVLISVSSFAAASGLVCDGQNRLSLPDHAGMFHTFDLSSISDTMTDNLECRNGNDHYVFSACGPVRTRCNGRIGSAIRIEQKTFLGVTLKQCKEIIALPNHIKWSLIDPHQPNKGITGQVTTGGDLCPTSLLPYTLKVTLHCNQNPTELSNMYACTTPEVCSVDMQASTAAACPVAATAPSPAVQTQQLPNNNNNNNVGYPAVQQPQQNWFDAFTIGPSLPVPPQQVMSQQQQQPQPNYPTTYAPFPPHMPQQTQQYPGYVPQPPNPQMPSTTTGQMPNTPNMMMPTTQGAHMNMNPHQPQPPVVYGPGSGNFVAPVMMSVGPTEEQPRGVGEVKMEKSSEEKEEEKLRRKKEEEEEIARLDRDVEVAKAILKASLEDDDVPRKKMYASSKVSMSHEKRSPLLRAFKWVVVVLGCMATYIALGMFVQMYFYSRSGEEALPAGGGWVLALLPGTVANFVFIVLSEASGWVVRLTGNNSGYVPSKPGYSAV